MLNNSFVLSEIIQPLSSKDEVLGFDCGDDDLNDFLLNDSLLYQDFSIARTLLCCYESRLIGYFTLTSDAIVLASREKKKLLKEKHRDVYNFPAIKIARMAFLKEYRGCGLGRSVIDYVAGLIFDLNENMNIGCRFITVDAYPQSIGFYEKVGFTYNQSKQYRDKEHPSMRLDVYGMVQNKVTL